MIRTLKAMRQRVLLDHRVHIHYTERVRSEPKRFVHSETYRAADYAQACAAAVTEFERLALLSGVAWPRAIDRIEVDQPGMKREVWAFPSAGASEYGEA